MTERTQIIAIAVFMTAICAAALFGLNRCNNHSVGGNNMITTDSSWAITQQQPTTAQTPATLYIDTGSVRYKTIWRTKYRDTGSVRIDSFFRDLPPFSLQGAEFVTAKKDTITAQYRYPANQFEYEARYSPDTVLTITTREYIKPDKVQFGVQGGVGAAVGFDGIVRPAVFVGLGVNYKF